MANTIVHLSGYFVHICNFAISVAYEKTHQLKS